MTKILVPLFLMGFRFPTNQNKWMTAKKKTIRIERTQLIYMRFLLSNWDAVRNILHSKEYVMECLLCMIGWIHWEKFVKPILLTFRFTNFNLLIPYIFLFVQTGIKIKRGVLRKIFPEVFDSVNYIPPL